ncbi:MAG: hypothetical protein ACREOJ_06670 [Gemmatimonadaceae bacterium]
MRKWLQGAPGPAGGARLYLLRFTLLLLRVVSHTFLFDSLAAELARQADAHTPMKTRRYRDTDWLEWLRLSRALFPQHSDEDLATGMHELRARADAEVFVIEHPDGSLAGFVEVGARPYADGCDTSPVGYLEARYVDPDV